MSKKANTEVVIGGKVYKVGGYEQPEYLQRIAAYINDKIGEYGSFTEFRRLPASQQSLLLQLNIADDYFKAREQVAQLSLQLEQKEQELYDLKHDLITAQMKEEKAQKTLDDLAAENQELRVKLARMGAGSSKR